MTAEIDAERLKKIRADLGLSQVQMAEAIGLGGKEPARTIREWEAGKTITGPAQLAIAYLGQGEGAAVQNGLVPEYVGGSELDGSGKDADAREFVVRLWRPRFIAVVMSAKMPVPTGAIWAWIKPDIERLVVGCWIDDPAAPPGFDAEILVERASMFYQIRTHDDLK